ncbi:uncharacterized protein LOC126965205 isoform X19 [Leptidea sinapis]|uniref:uncharacterized protein LOC126965205 isoform X2 n=1 Tax=Leptidea sinapis TaxID=189913 RepID=UPI00213626E3|nr:uncharacterized protein LOC126965205 isoform X2 [Leptidea sinapis]XP_050664608.1 uncharacterized protein LOC126965205 isoform X6 [Leptidea sinapis]XP_050664612.1 uncharacterized protein LOC126965205 isoform X9 [Leptidea sinapis]XP_050664617.1 uncharacterized protein LOC126965205 isoform X13 [Leptidea sinapis]XP_050664618.1 uncharacterized protein LOC126965205 isoform X14 [Leptidea sinapis]XP_050664621.1 uncharacterized protein LOC126965205 isoform X17 [Leptidea sinapis]XP_050664622.1 uncha
MICNMLILYLISVIGISSAQILGNGQCDTNVPLELNFDLDKFAGRWNVIERTVSPLQTGECSYIDINAVAPVTDGTNNFNVVLKSVVDNFPEDITGAATAQNGNAIYTMNLPGYQALEFRVMLTDYENYALAYSCQNVGTTQKNLFIWQLGRGTSFPSEMILNLMNQTLITNFGYTSDILTGTSHSADACTELPEIPAGENVILTGQCDPNLPVVNGIDLERFQGEWYQVAAYHSNVGQGTCQRARYTLNGAIVDVVNSQVSGQQLETISGNATFSGSDGSARFTVTLEVMPNVYNQASLWILATDYDNYAITYTCRNLNSNQKQVTSWILSKSREISTTARNAVNQVISNYVDLNDRYYIVADQSDAACFYYPEPTSGPVVFRGQCDQNINVVNNFNIDSFEGRWFDIQSYPSNFQGGTCNTASYTKQEGTNLLDVVNSQVINQSLLRATGVARLAGAANVGKLIVTINNEDLDYWVLATDYSTYALMYTCTNIDTETMQVNTWKLSRTRALSANANTAINNVMNTIPVLDQRYFITRDHSDTGCFFFPEPQTGVPVEFPGQCDTNIEAMANFNVNLFEGTWYEIESYPEGRERGQCINYEYVVVNENNLQLSINNVQGQALLATPGTAVRTDSSGRLTLNLQTGAGVMQVPFWILSTDYSNYALAYGCVNLAETRRVFSFKLSRTKTLTAQSTTAINAVINTIPVLDSRYYQTIGQSDADCFYLPPFVPGEPVIMPGQCDTNIPVLRNFNVARFTGRWRLISSYFSERQSGECNEAEYTQRGNVIDLENRHVVNQQLLSVSGNATIVSTDESAKLQVNIGTNPPVDYWILDSDYDTYFIAYSCVNQGTDQRRVWSWIMSRTDSLPAAATASINSVIDSIDVLDNRYFIAADQSDAACFYYPEPTPSPVVFRGQCDQNINVVNNFNIDSFEGRWFDIQSYPSNFQGGTCNTASYTKQDGTNLLDVVNSQVINQSLFRATGVARLAGAANVGKLIVTINNEDLDYWVLATDYSTYALMYTCTNIDTERMQVNTWKLSRTRALSANANTAINNVMNTIPVLDERYFITRDHSDTGCFFFPEPQPGVPVEFPGQCDTNIEAMANFNVNLFEGTWYEIESYPEGRERGQCINYEYVVVNENNLQLSINNVQGQALLATPGTAVRTDSSGRLTLNLQTGAGVMQVPFWILSTDYSNYALAYGCVNLAETRRVFSFKLSRTKTLTAQSTTAINAVINTIPVLDSRYYQTIGQSDADCFYLPPFVPGEPVIMPGQCDTNIPVLRNFNVARFTGRWRLISSYFSERQSGECNEAEYTQRGNVIDLENRHVVNQQLLSVSGNATIVSTDESAKLQVNIGTNPPVDYWILDSDYDTYFIAYSCVNQGTDQRRVWSWIMSRTDSLPAAATASINSVIDSIDVLDNRYFIAADQSDAACFYYPEPTPSPVVFRGQCDQNINVVNNFNIDSFEGRWFDIQSYPSNFQGGTCNTASYTKQDGTNLLDVVNSQVINQSLFRATGVARLAGAANVGKLIVTINNEDLDYWVLATDYSTYALMYTCTNIDTERMQVNTWKLSRTRALSANANTAINNVMNTIPVLDERYFITRDHSDTGCFFFPEPQPGVPVEFPGVCDENIQAMPNFNVTLFEGLWHEIESYPEGRQRGQCINFEYLVQNENNLQVTVRNVQGNDLFTIPGTAIRFDNTGRLTLNLQTAAGVMAIPFWILSTDYSNYALAYGCVNLEETRRVFSFKLSRTKALSAASNTTINNIIDTIPVLDNMYYEFIDQSDDACFYLPPFVPIDPVIFPGQCDETIPALRNFDVTRFQGRWRLISSYFSERQSGECNEAIYTERGNYIDLENRHVEFELLQSVAGTASVVSNDNSAKLQVNISTNPTADFWILDSDYDTYFIAYSCSNINNDQRRVWSWIMSRTASLPAAAITNIDRVINSINVLDNRYFIAADQSDAACFYYPVPDGNPVVFRGQCDESIRVVSPFDATRYMGTWYDIESFPAAFQFGSCSTANYALNGSVVDVVNTEVLGQRLITFEGYAVPGADETAKLTVYFNIPGQGITAGTPYWVLATDYNNYALVYTCTNVDAEYRSVRAWKLSRTKSLSAESAAAINTVTNTIDVIRRQQYYIPRGHTDEDCYYYPDNNGGPVFLEGECDSSVTAGVVTNFNLNSFAGSWYEVSRYPSELTSGTCVRNEFDITTANTFNGSKSFVVGEKLSVFNGPVTVAADGRGVLTASLSDNTGATYETTMYVMSVDYNDYALLYSCRNVGNNTRQVYSWKLSRNQEGLSAQAVSNINTIVSQTEDLFEGYFEDTNQTTDGCFYYPQYDTLPDQIVFSTPCNENIRGVPNFSAGDYLGKWYELASYPQSFQFGDCARARYETEDGIVVTVINTQVYNQSLDVMYGTAVVASDDNSGVLNVTFNFPGGVSALANYYILATDYSSYALVYSCRNLEGGRSQVTSWKLSRTRSLSAEANAVMANVISNTRGLSEDFYEPTSQSDEACFYVPELDRDQAPLFRGQCEDIEVQGVQGFDATRFVGWWHEIERYPTDTNPGSCISLTFQQVDNGFQIVDTNVINNIANVTTSTVTVSNNGLLRKTYSNGNVVEYWVLATDYESYALLYSCQNANSDYKRVWSAKLSKTRSLTTAAQNAINQVINNKRVLDQSLFVNVDQSDSTCFHYPEQPGAFIVIPGQCRDLPLQQQFSVPEYSGTWYQIEKYRQPFESGNCTGARYTLIPNTEVVSVLNWEVVNGVLNTIDGTATVNSTDGSGYLEVNLNRVNDTATALRSTSLYILTTDYVSYSLVYNCRNLDSFRRQISVWKLSRTRSLLEAGQTAINEYMSGREEFRAEYFDQVDQDDSCPEPSSAMLFRGSVLVLLISVALLYLS